MYTTTSSVTRVMAAAGGIALATSLLSMATAPPASAAGCRVGVVCGAVKNRSGRTMSYTTNLGEGSGYCDVWNWNGGTGSSFLHAHCDQQSMGNGTRGGLGSGVDVDAFTFNGEGYHERFTRLGTWHWRAKGVWTKVNNAEIADCGIGDSNQIWCTVLYQ